jgi:hypothetical protein
MPAIVPPATDFPAEPRPARREARFSRAPRGGEARFSRAPRGGEARFIRFSHFAVRFVPVCVTERMKR